ncbi:MAG: hypothetical protein PHY92_01445 [Alphaproteobacteria bacterium]|nr:hypothetical protein [Alphaproteobacteria bacterium]
MRAWPFPKEARHAAEKGSSKEVISENIKTEMKAGKPQKQAIAIAIALDLARRSGKEKRGKKGK